MDKKINKMTLHYDDGSSKFVEGMEYERWNGFTTQMMVFCTAHKNLPDFATLKWTEVPAPPKYVDNMEPEIVVPLNAMQKKIKRVKDASKVPVPQPKNNKEAEVQG